MAWLPSTSLEIYRWMLVLSCFYIATRLLLIRVSNRDDEGIAVIGDALTFAGSIILLLGVWSPDVLHAIGNTSVFLMLAGLAGIWHSVRSAARR